MWEALEQTHWVQTFSTTGWMYASVSVIHYLTMFWFIGSVAVVDLRVMGVAEQPPATGSDAALTLTAKTANAELDYQFYQLQKNSDFVVRRSGQDGYFKVAAYVGVLGQRIGPAHHEQGAVEHGRGIEHPRGGSVQEFPAREVVGIGKRFAVGVIRLKL